MSNRSLLSKIEEFILRQTKPKYMNSKEDVKSYLKNKHDEEVKTIFNTKYYNCYVLCSFSLLSFLLGYASISY